MSFLWGSQRWISHWEQNQAGVSPSCGMSLSLCPRLSFGVGLTFIKSISNDGGSSSQVSVWASFIYCSDGSGFGQVSGACGEGGLGRSVTHSADVMETRTAACCYVSVLSFVWQACGHCQGVMEACLISDLPSSQGRSKWQGVTKGHVLKTHVAYADIADKHSFWHLFTMEHAHTNQLLLVPTT